MLAYFPDAVDADVTAAQNPELDKPNENPLDSNVEDGGAAAAPNPELEKPIGTPLDPPNVEDRGAAAAPNPEPKCGGWAPAKYVILNAPNGFSPDPPDIEEDGGAAGAPNPEVGAPNGPYT